MSVKLEKENGVFTKTVELPKIKVLYKVRTSYLTNTAYLVELLISSISPPTLFYPACHLAYLRVSLLRCLEANTIL